MLLPLQGAVIQMHLNLRALPWAVGFWAYSPCLPHLAIQRYQAECTPGQLVTQLR